jgi:hypothetical protein
MKPQKPTVELLPQELLVTIPSLGETVAEEDPMIWVKLHNPVSGWRWYLIELQQLAADAICYVYEVGWDEQRTYFHLSDLDRHAADVGEPNHLDTSFVPCRLSVVQARERGLQPRFPLGQVVGTPGALAALHATQQRPLDFLKRHAQGDWGELDAHDVVENEFSLQHGFRLLSAYALSDGTRIWIITEADRSVTTLLLPEEY